MTILTFLQYFRNLSNNFINILEILQDFNEIFSKYFLNITVLCGWRPDFFAIWQGHVKHYKEFVYLFSFNFTQLSWQYIRI